MNYQRLTVNLPEYIYIDLIKSLGRGKISKFVSNAVKTKLLEKKLKKENNIDAFFSHRDNLPKLTGKRILEAIRKGRI